MLIVSMTWSLVTLALSIVIPKNYLKEKNLAEWWFVIDKHILIQTNPESEIINGMWGKKSWHKKYK